MTSDLKSRAVRECLLGLENAISDRVRQIRSRSADLAASGVLDDLRRSQLAENTAGAVAGLNWSLRLVRAAVMVLDDDGRTT